MPTFSRQLTSEDCEKWEQSKKSIPKNPITNRNIINGSVVFKAIDKE